MHQPGWRSHAGVFSTLTGHCQLVLRMVGLEALELDLRPNPFAKGSVAFVRPSALWLEELLSGDRTVGVVLWGATPDSRQKSPAEIVRRIRLLRSADLRLQAELNSLEEAFFASGGDWWAADIEPELRQWVDQRPSHIPTESPPEGHG
jgi:hypothetical protein